MRRAGAVVAAIVVFFLILAFVFDRVIVIRHGSHPPLAQLVVAQGPSGFTAKASLSNPVTTANNPFAAYRAAAQRSPGSTGAYSASWSRTASSRDSATLLVSLLPSDAAAVQTESQVVQQYLGPGSYSRVKYVLAGPVPLPGVAGAKGALYKPATGPDTTPVVSVAFRVGRAAVLEVFGLTGSAQAAESGAATFAQGEARHLGAALRTHTSVPPLATAIYWGVAGAAVLIAVGVPLGRSRRRTRRARSQAQSARHTQVRGSKIARRQARRR